LVQIPREVYQILQLLARWEIYDNSACCEKADETVIDLTEGFPESASKSAQKLASYVGRLNLVFRPILIQYT
jgi:hypothetical protein